MRQYLDLLQNIIDNGVVKTDRTGVGTKSVFGRQLRFNLQEGFPMVTTKRLHWKSIVAEALWFLRGDTNIKYLVENGVRIWSDWPYKHYCRAGDINHPEVPTRSKESFEQMVASNQRFASIWGDLGPVYGKQWRSWRNITRVDPDDDYVMVNNPIDQIAKLVNDLKTNPDSRRMIVNAWNPADIDEMAVRGLPPCHYAWQVVTRPSKFSDVRTLDLMINIRSSDVFLGLPFNIASYALILRLLAAEVCMFPGELVVTTGDTHLYLNHLEQAQEQLKRTPGKLPELWIRSEPRTILATSVDDPNAYKIDDLTLTGYSAAPSIKAQVAV